MEKSTLRMIGIGAAGALLATAIAYLASAFSASLDDLERERVVQSLRANPEFLSAVASQISLTIDDTRARALANQLAPREVFRHPLIKAVREDENLRRELQLPVGTILSSMLTPEDFESAHGKGWQLADGSRVAGTAYAAQTGGDRLPDLRAMFLRGVNAGRTDAFKDPEERAAGTPQPASLAQHKHRAHYLRANPNASKGGGDHHKVTDDETRTLLEIRKCDDCGAETRPNNIAVYFYIRVD